MYLCVTEMMWINKTRGLYSRNIKHTNGALETVERGVVVEKNNNCDL